MNVTREEHMRPRITRRAFSVPGVLDALQALSKAANEAARQAGLPRSTVDLVSLRASQINGCAVCLDMHARALKKAGETDERLFTLAAWRDAPYLSDAERAALGLTEAATRRHDRPDPVPDEIWNEAAKHFDEKGLAAIVLMIGITNLFNRVNVATKQLAGQQEW